MNKFILKCQAALANKKAEMYIDKSVWVVALLVVGALLLFGIYTIVEKTVLPSLQTAITKMFADGKNDQDLNPISKSGFTGESPAA